LWFGSFDLNFEKREAKERQQTVSHGMSSSQKWGCHGELSCMSLCEKERNWESLAPKEKLSGNLDRTRYDEGIGKRRYPCCCQW
jgi:hypothetical protein